MGLIVYDGKTVIDAKNKIDTYNGEILEALEKINNEFVNMSSTLDTPKSSKTIPKMIEKSNEMVTYVSNSKDNYNSMFDTITGEYNEYMETVNKMVGGNND